MIRPICEMKRTDGPKPKSAPPLDTRVSRRLDSAIDRGHGAQRQRQKPHASGHCERKYHELCVERAITASSATRDDG
jgi:hypothetical protein